jgi:hypothetical protein
MNGKIVFGGTYRDPVLAVSMLAGLPCWGYIVFRGKIVVKSPTGYKKEYGNKWSRPTKYASKAIWWSPRQ